MSDRGQKAYDYFMQGYNCCQAVVLAYSDLTGLNDETGSLIASGFGGGIGRTRSVCGTVSGMVMVANMLRGYSDPKDSAGKKETYQMIQQLLDKFKEQNGSIICAELLGLKPMESTNPTPSERTDEYYKKRPCPLLCKDAAEILESYLEENQ
ncbi:MAG: C-GCAxxG-C-C family protein [Acutalibacteraceae bacterium]|nr:C-GCAxxG-C-C family protein [Acutalibacteraceae bacterium]